MGPEGKPLEPGSLQVGEVQCRGPTVFEGYWQLPHASLEAFSDGWFCTGDLATINRAGYITVVDRIKDMILHGQYLLHTHIALPASLAPTPTPCDACFTATAGAIQAYIVPFKTHNCAGKQKTKDRT